MSRSFLVADLLSLVAVSYDCLQSDDTEQNAKPEDVGDLASGGHSIYVDGEIPTSEHQYDLTVPMHLP